MLLPETLAAPFVGLVLVVLFIAFVREWLKPDVAAMAAVAVLLASGVLSAHDVVGVFGNSAPITIACLFIISGALLIEIVFSIQGMGTLMYNAILMQDYPVIQAVFIILTFMVLSMNLLAEFLYGIADPRVGDSLDRGVNV